MMADEKFVDEFAPVPRYHGRVPDGRRREEDQRAEYNQARSQQRSPGAGQNQVWRNDHQRQNDPDQALRQRRQPQRETEDVPQPVDAGPRFFALPQEEAEKRGFDRYGQRQVACHGAREARPQPAGYKRRRAQISEPRRTRAAAEEVEQQRAESRDRGDAEPGAEFVFAEQRVARGQEPVRQCGLLEPLDPAESRSDPVSGRVHLARDFGVARLVGTDERQSPEPVEEDNRAQNEERDQIEMFGIVFFYD